MLLSRNNGAAALLRVALAALALGILAGCIADTAEDSDLPWARNQGWEGMIPLPVNSPSGPAYD